jgi:hypothetical protein
MSNLPNMPRPNANAINDRNNIIIINDKEFWDKRILQGIGEHFSLFPNMHENYGKNTPPFSSVMRHICNCDEQQKATRTNLIANGNNPNEIYERLKRGLTKPNSNPIYFIRNYDLMSIVANTPVFWLVAASEIIHGASHHDYSYTFKLHNINLAVGYKYWNAHDALLIKNAFMYRFDLDEIEMSLVWPIILRAFRSHNQWKISKRI